MMKNIKIIQRREHRKASEVYLDVVFDYGSQVCEWSIPIEYRRTGVHLSDSSKDELEEYILKVYHQCHPDNWNTFLDAQKAFWSERPNADITKEFYDVLEGNFKWRSARSELPANPNSQRRIQQLKEYGYTIATSTREESFGPGRSTTYHLLIPLPRGGITGYETWSTSTRNRIVRVLGGVDVYENNQANQHSLLPDHKFPEIRWDENVRRANLDALTDEEIKRDFQLISNQRNQQKREVCRKCFQTGIRGTIFGIEYYYSGSREWPKTIPVRGKSAEAGCIGCPWYDIEEWRFALNEQHKDAT
jgi:hypothetical protein